LKFNPVTCQVGLCWLASLKPAPLKRKYRKEWSYLKGEPSQENTKPIDKLVGSQDLENHSISNAAESNWASVVGLVPAVESRDLRPINRIGARRRA
jgi:hypothetical protein